MKDQGIYQIENLENGMVYIGQTYNKRGFDMRWQEHKRALEKNKHHNTYLQRAWNKYGSHNFDFVIIEHVDDVNLLDIREQYWLDTTVSHHYNMQKEAGGSSRGLKKNLTDIAKQNVANANKSRPWTKEDRKKLSIALTGIKRSEEHKEKTRKRMMGNNLYDQSRKKNNYKKEGFKGVIKKSDNSWQSGFKIKGNKFYCGSFDNEIEAAKNYDYHIIRLFGKEIAFLNFPEFDYENFIPKRTK